jgi:hypothetical protein
MTRKQKKKVAIIKENELYILPSLNEEMRTFVNKFKVDMMEHVVLSIEFAIKNKLPLVEIFQFKDSPFVVTITEKEFDANLSHIRQFYMENQIYELCPRVEQLREILKEKPNEKKTIEDYNRPSNSTE